MLASTLALIMFCTPISFDSQNDTIQTVYATGAARYFKRTIGPESSQLAERKAQIAAARNLLTKLEQIKKNNKHDPSPQLANGKIRSYRYLPAKYYRDGTVIVTAELVIHSNNVKQLGARGTKGQASRPATGDNTSTTTQPAITTQPSIITLAFATTRPAI